MPRTHYALRLIPSRPDFAQTMTDEERGIMQQHLAYWNDHMSRGRVVVFGPVLDPAGIYGLGVISVQSDEELQEFMKHDPAATINRYEYHPMMAVVPDRQPA